MAQVGEGDIRVSHRTVGRVRVDPGLLRGEAGPFEPRLIIPISIEMYNRPAEQMIALLQLEAFLHVGDSVNPATQIGSPTTVSLLQGFPVRSLPEGGMAHSVDLRFELIPASVHRLEVARHAVRDGPFLLHLRLQGPLAWLRTTRGGAAPLDRRGGNEAPEDPFQLQLGLHSELSLLWTTSIDSLRVQIEPSVWLSSVLPGLGVDNLQLVEIALPPGLPEIGNAARVFRDAEDAYHARRYDDCIGRCRGIIRAWNKQLAATSSRHLSDVVGDSQKWPLDDPRRRLLDSVWQSLLDAGNVPHHPEAQVTLYEPTADDARLHLMMTAVVSEYLFRVLRAP